MSSRFENKSMGYYPPSDVPLTYMQWSESYGKYRWFHEDGSPRLYYDLDFNWAEIYSKVTRDADIAFMYRVIDDVPGFTSEFLSRVPTNWLKYKSMLELMVGTLDGQNIDPSIFEAGFTRETYEVNDSKYDSAVNLISDIKENEDIGSRSDSQDSVIGSRKDTTTNNQHTSNTTDVTGTETNKDTNTDKGRSINYTQGVQAYTDFSTDIGRNGNDFADSFNDTLGENKSDRDKKTSQKNSLVEDVENQSTANVGEQIISNNSILGNQKNSKDSLANNNSSTDSYQLNKKGEVITEKRINFYDNLAFLRTRVDLMQNIEPFHSMFDELFLTLTTIPGFWSTKNDWH